MTRGQATPIGPLDVQGKPQTVSRSFPTGLPISSAPSFHPGPARQGMDLKRVRARTRPTGGRTWKPPDNIFSLRCIRTGTRPKPHAICVFLQRITCDQQDQPSTAQACLRPEPEGFATPTGRRRSFGAPSEREQSEPARDQKMVELIGIEPMT